MAAHLSSMSSESQNGNRHSPSLWLNIFQPALLTTLNILLKMQVESYKPPVRSEISFRGRFVPVLIQTRSQVTFPDFSNFDLARKLEADMSVLFFLSRCLWFEPSAKFEGFCSDDDGLHTKKKIRTLPLWEWNSGWSLGSLFLSHIVAD